MNDMQIKTAKLMPPAEADLLQPLREVGSQDKTQFWADEDIMKALRLANFRGISLDKLRKSAAAPSPELTLKAG